MIKSCVNVDHAKSVAAISTKCLKKGTIIHECISHYCYVFTIHHVCICRFNIIASYITDFVPRDLHMEFNSPDDSVQENDFTADFENFGNLLSIVNFAFLTLYFDESSNCEYYLFNQIVIHKIMVR